MLLVLVMLTPFTAWAQVTYYNLRIGETWVSSENAGDVVGDNTVSFTPADGTNPAKLTLNDARLNTIRTEIDNLVIEVNGTCDISPSGGDSAAIQRSDPASLVGATSLNLTFTGTGFLKMKPNGSYMSIWGFTPSYDGMLTLGSYNTVGEPFAVAKQILGGGDGSYDTPYLIGSVADLKNLSIYVNETLLSNKYYKLTDDLNCSGLSGFEPIGSATPFKGTFDGNNKTISNLSLSNQSSNVGLFGQLGDYDGNSGTVKDLIIKDCTFNGIGSYCGAIAGYVASGVISGCKVTGETIVSCVGESGANGVYAGAIIGGCAGATLSNNIYEYSVTTSTKIGTENEVEKYNYDYRGMGKEDSSTNLCDIFTNNGAVMYTKLVNIPGETAGQGSVEGAETRYMREGADYESEMYIAPGESAMFSVRCEDGYIPQTVQVTYGTPATTINPTLESFSDSYYYYNFEMPDEEATISVTYASGSAYNLSIGNTPVTTANADNVLGDGTVSFSVGGDVAVIYTLTLNGAELTEPIKIGLDNLTFDIQGTNSITTTEPCIQKIENTDPSVTFKSTSTPVGSLIMTNTGDEAISEIGEGNITISKELAVLLTLYGYDDYTSRLYYITDGSTTVAKIVPGYGVSMGKGGGHRLDIYEGNAADVFGDGTVSFNKNTNTLTLNGANKGDLSTSLSELTIELVGDNTLSEDGSFPVLRSLNGATVNINIQSTGETKGTLTMSQPYTQAGNFYDGNVTVNIIEPLAVVSGSLTGNKNNENTVVIEQIRNIGLTVSGVVVTNANAANVLGDGKVSYANGMLTLNGATLAIGITSSLDQLKIVLKGESSIAGTIAGTGTLYFATDASDAKLTFTTESASAVSGFTEVTYLNGLRMKPTTGGFEVLIPSDYNLMVNGISVTPGNRTDVFADGGSVIYDGEYTLILTNATLTQKIELGSENTLDNLYIYLAGQNNTITSDDNVIVATAKPNMELHFVTNGNSPGKLVYTSTHASNPTLEGAFTGFKKVSFDNELEAILSGKTITFAQKIEPIINADPTSGKSSNANVDLTDANTKMEQYNTPGANLNNMIVGDILFTLNDDGTKDSPDGYDGSNVVINSEVSDEDLAAAMNLEPGSDAFNEKFTGLTFKLPASTGTISIKAWSLNGHQMCVKIGDQTATYITLTATPTTYDIDYTCGSDTYVYIYLPKSTPSTAPRHVRGRIGPKSGVSGGLGSISVSSNSMVSAASSQPASNYMLLDRMAADAIISSVIPGEGLAFNDASITDLEDDMFLTGGGASSAPRRAAAPALKISSNLPFIDMRGTSIKNMEVSRSSGPFNGVPENVFIYMPAGNTTSEKNVVIGDVCDRMELKAELPGSGENEAKPFKVSKNFTAAQATLMRTFAEGGDESKATIYLPYAIPQEDANLLGQFFEFNGIDGGVVKMTKVTEGGLKANKPYIFQAKAGGVVNPEVKIVTVQGMPGETEGFKGVYEQTTCGGDNWYGYAAEEVDGATVGQFVKLGTGASIAPFRAYMVADGNAPSYAIRWGGVDEETTAIEEPEIKTVNERKPVEGWYTLTGARLVSQPTKPGLYIYNGRTVVVK